jgi:hypothetical protein
MVLMSLLCLSSRCSQRCCNSSCPVRPAKLRTCSRRGPPKRASARPTSPTPLNTPSELSRSTLLLLLPVLFHAPKAPAGAVANRVASLRARSSGEAGLEELWSLRASKFAGLKPLSGLRGEDATGSRSATMFGLTRAGRCAARCLHPSMPPHASSAYDVLLLTSDACIYIYSDAYIYIYIYIYTYIVRQSVYRTLDAVGSGGYGAENPGRCGWKVDCRCCHVCVCVCVCGCHVYVCVCVCVRLRPRGRSSLRPSVRLGGVGGEHASSTSRSLL